MKRFKSAICITIFMALYLVLSFFVVFSVSRSGTYPSGSDTMNYVYKANLLVQEIAKGNFYPLYDPFLYNGVQIMRLEPPVGLYVLAFCQMIMGGDPFRGYILFVGAICFLSGFVWLCIGTIEKRPIFGGILGAISFFLPINLYNLFEDGNIPRAIILVIFPILIHHIYRYMNEKRWRSLHNIFFLTVLAGLTDISLIMTMLPVLLVFLVIYTIVDKEYQRSINIMVAILLGIAIGAMWLIPAMFGGGLLNNRSVMSEKYFQQMHLTINPIYRLINNRDAGIYYGGSLALVGIFGMFFSKKESKPEFWTASIFLVLTSDLFFGLLRLLPGSQYMEFIKFLPICCGFVLFGLLVWKDLRRSIAIIIIALLVLDSVPSEYLYRGNAKNIPLDMRFEIIEDVTLIDTAKKITKQRMALLDNASLGATAPYLISSYENPVMSAFGAKYHSAITAQNIVQLNQAVADGKYVYLFDRALELGNDTVLIQMDQVFSKYDDTPLIDEAAEKVGYKLVDYYDKYRLYHFDTYDSFGVISQYSGLAIGTSSRLIAVDFPNFEETDDTNINHYSYEKLSSYDTIYLAGFTYDDKAEAEELVRRLAADGVKIIIAADGLPVVKNTGVKSFLGVDCFNIEFKNGFPDFIMANGDILSVDMFPSNFSRWGTVYMNNLQSVGGYVEENGEQLDFLGSVCDGNVVFISFNLTYYYSLTRDSNVMEILEDSTGLPSNKLPLRKIVPVKITADKNKITVESEEDNVNTTLAFHDIFSSERPIENVNNMLTVHSGTTVITMKYPYMLQGIIATVIVTALTVLFMIQSRKWEQDKAEYEEKHKNDSEFHTYE